jgi:hypothetical protein
MGTELSEEALKIFTRDLSQLTNEQIRTGLERTRREVRGGKGFAPKLILQDVLERAGVISEEEVESLDAVAAWDEAERLVDRFGFYNGAGDVVLRRRVGKPEKECETCHGEGFTIGMVTYKDQRGRESQHQAVKDCNCRSIEELPDISPRLQDVVRRIGGWGVLKDIPPARFPFTRRDFLLEYGRWRKVESLPGPKGSMLAIGNMAGGSASDLLETLLRESS